MGMYVKKYYFIAIGQIEAFNNEKVIELLSYSVVLLHQNFLK